MYRLRLIPMVLVWIIVPAISHANSSIAGTVKDDKNAPLKAAQVHLLDAKGRDTIGLTDEAGRFSIPDLEPGEYRAKAERKFYRPSDTQTLRVNSSMKDVRFTLSALEKPPVSTLSTADIKPFLPEGPAKELFADRCGRCHSIGLPLSQAPLDRNGWEGLVNRLSSNVTGFSGVINDQVKGPILDYLAKNFGPGSTLAAEMGAKAKKAYREEVPVGHDLIYWNWNLHGEKVGGAEPHTAVADGNGSVWFTEWGAHKVARLQTSTGKITEFELKTPNVRPFSITASADRKVWFTAGPELGVIDAETGTMKEIKLPESPDGKPVNAEHIIFSGGKLWYGFSPPGSVGSYDPATQQFKSYQIEEGKASPSGITRQGDRFWFVLASTLKVGSLNSETGKVETFPIPTPRIYGEHLRVDPKGRVWLGEQAEHKLWMVDPSTKRTEPFNLPYSCEPYAVNVDAKGKVWAICFMRESLVKFDPDTKAMTEYPQPIGDGGVDRELLTDREGTMWFATWYRAGVVGVKQLP